MSVIDTVEIVAFALYGLLAFACLVSVAYSLREIDSNRFKVQQWFHGFLFSFVLFRLLWCILRAVDGSSVVTFIVNRIGFTLYFTAFTLVLFYWVENYHKTYVSSREFLPRFFKLFVATNGIMWAYEITLMLVFVFATNRVEEGNPVYDLSIYTIIAFSFAVSLSFAIYGIRLYLRHRFAQDWEEDTSERSAELLKVFACTFFFCIAFLLRGIAFLYRPVTGKKIDNDVFLILGYFIPELIPSFLEFYIVRTIKKKNIQDTTFIDTLYQQADDLRDTPQNSALNLDNLSQSPSISIHSTSPPLGPPPSYSTPPPYLSPLLGSNGRKSRQYPSLPPGAGADDGNRAVSEKSSLVDNN